MVGEGSTHIYRFLCIPSFAPPVSVRLHVNDVGNGTVSLKRMGRVWRQDRQPELRLSTQYKLSVHQVSKYLALIELMDFWNLPPRPEWH